MRLGVPMASAASTARPRVVGVHMHRIVAAAVGTDAAMATDSPNCSRCSRSFSTPLGVAAAEQVHHFELRRRRRGRGDRDAGRWPQVLVPVGRLAGERGGHRVQQHQQSATAGVDHPGFREHVELLGGLVQGETAASAAAAQRRRGPRRRRPRVRRHPRRPAGPRRWCPARPRPWRRRPGRQHAAAPHRRPPRRHRPARHPALRRRRR